MNENIQHREWLGKEIVDISYNIHSTLGPGLLEKVYESCFCYELKMRNIPFFSQVSVPIAYKDFEIMDGLRLDLLIDRQIIIELKAQENAHAVWEAQLLSYLKLADIKLGYLINFSVPVMKAGIKRMML